MQHWVVFEIEKRSTGIILLTDQAKESAITEKCWNRVYEAPFNPLDDEEVALVHGMCEAWVEQNRVPGSKYAITEMFLIEK